MGFYSDVIFPRLCDFLLNKPLVAHHRQLLLATAYGEVLEVGFGTGLNLPHYPAEVRRITTVEPLCQREGGETRRLIAASLAGIAKESS